MHSKQKTFLDSSFTCRRAATTLDDSNTYTGHSIATTKNFKNKVPLIRIHCNFSDHFGLWVVCMLWCGHVMIF